jgi:ABC-type antimicrobial peptide transport system permease subunit
VYFVVRTTGGSGLPAVRETLAELQPALVLAGDVSLADAVTAARQPRRFSLLLLSAFGLTALLLTIVGLFGHLSHSIRAREHELGVRMALGAWPGRLIHMILRQGVILVAAGAVIGLLFAFGLSRFMSSLLYEVAPSDPVTFAVSALLVLGVGAGASYLPARRLSRLDPAVSLRVE